MSGRLHILCVEDNDNDFMLVERELRKIREEFTLERAIDRRSFEEALARRPDVILCDHNLPSFSSTEAFGILRTLDIRVPFILVTATMGEQESVGQINLGVDDYILKDRLPRLPSAVIRAVRYSRIERDKEMYYQALIQKERRFRALVEHSAEAVLLCDERLQIIYVSPAFYRIFGIDDIAAKGRALSDVIGPRNRKQFISFCGNALRHPAHVFQDTFEVDGAGRSPRWVECAINNLLHEQHVGACVVNIRDISQRVMFEGSLGKTQSVLAAIISNSEISYVLVDTQFRVVTYNSQAESRYLLELGKTLTEGDVIFEYLPEQRKAPMRALYQNALEGRKFRYEADFRQPDGSEHWYEVNVFPVHDNSGDLLGIIIATAEITDRKEAELEKDRMTADLVAQNKNLEQFAFIISHNLRAPVANILGLAGLLEMPKPLTPVELGRCAKGMSDAAKNIDRVIKDLHLILRTRSALTESKQVVDLEVLAADVEETLKPEAGDDSFIVTADLEVKEYRCIRSYMHSVFLNLMGNSLRYRQRGITTKISIRSRVHDGKLVIEFEDNSLGIDLEQFGDKVFGLYRRFHDHAEGKGMGLYMVKTQVELMGGRVSINSEVSKGTKFTIVLPL